jgi:histidinol dehydrogenase
MNTFAYPPRDIWDQLCSRPEFDRADLGNAVRSILKTVKIDGDKALFEFSEKFDKVKLSELKVSRKEIFEASDLVPDELQKAILFAKENIVKFHKFQLREEQPVETVTGVKCWRKNVAIEKVGLYIPGGSAPLFSTVLMLAVPAKLAGCNRIILCTPVGKDGKVNPVILFTADICGITEIFKAGGAQAIAAMAYGTETIPKVYKIFGPGNQYVTRAKELVQSEGTAIDIPAGPSEVLVIADSSADPSFIAADLLSQAEHGTDSQVVLATNDNDLIAKVKSEVEKQLLDLPRKEIASGALNNSLAVLFRTLDECIDFSNLYAPEHLIINTSDPLSLAGKVINAGSVFLGKYSCESAGDYASGTNHTLPTKGYAVNFGGVSTESFVKKITFQELTAEGISEIGPAIEKMAEAEELRAHRNAVSLRLKSIRK